MCAMLGAVVLVGLAGCAAQTPTAGTAPQAEAVQRHVLAETSKFTEQTRSAIANYSTVEGNIQTDVALEVSQVTLQSPGGGPVPSGAMASVNLFRFDNTTGEFVYAFSGTLPVTFTIADKLDTAAASGTGQVTDSFGNELTVSLNATWTATSDSTRVSSRVSVRNPDLSDSFKNSGSSRLASSNLDMQWNGSFLALTDGSGALGDSTLSRLVIDRQ